jgi:hypothetical protein
MKMQKISLINPLVMPKNTIARNLEKAMTPFLPSGPGLLQGLFSLPSLENPLSIVSLLNNVSSSRRTPTDCKILIQ